MATTDDELLVAIELHSVEGLRVLLDRGLDPRTPVRGKMPVTWLTEMYTRSERFAACLGLLLDGGGALDDPVVAPVLLDDGEALRAAIQRDASVLHHRTTMVSAFTPLAGASLLHLAAEYGHLGVARVLLEHGIDVNTRAAMDANGFNGQTALFHTVNSPANRSQPVLRALLEAGASTDLRLAGITWGSGFAWETTCVDVTPLSYAQLGLLPQMHRLEQDIYDNLALMLAAAGRQVEVFTNVPNRYLQPATGKEIA